MEKDDMDGLETKKRSKIISSLLSLITPGLGHLYNGKLVWAISIPSITLIFIYVIYYNSLLRSFTFFLVFAAFIIYVYIFSIVHSIVTAKRNTGYRLKSCNHIAIYVIWPIIFFGLGAILPANNSIRTFSIPTKSMEKTLRAGDLIMADMDYYNSNKVNRNDIAILSSTNSPDELMIKRVIAFGGEKISIVDGKIFIDGKEYVESNPNLILENNSSDDLGEMTIPKDHIFIIGDNRPNSLDSRMFGTIPVKNLKGKPLYVYFSSNLNRIGTKID